MSQHIIFVGLKSRVALFYLDHISRTVVEDDEALLTFPFCDNEQVGEEEESQILKITTSSRSQLTSDSPSSYNYFIVTNRNLSPLVYQISSSSSHASLPHQCSLSAPSMTIAFTESSKGQLLNPITFTIILLITIDHKIS